MNTNLNQRHMEADIVEKINSSIKERKAFFIERLEKPSCDLNSSWVEILNGEDPDVIIDIAKKSIMNSDALSAKTYILFREEAFLEEIEDISYRISVLNLEEQIGKEPLMTLIHPGEGQIEIGVVANEEPFFIRYILAKEIGFEDIFVYSSELKLFYTIEFVDSFAEVPEIKEAFLQEK